MKHQPFLSGAILAIAVYFYCAWSSETISNPYLASPETALWDRLEPIRMGLFVLATIGFIGAVAMYRKWRRAAAIIWAVVIVMVVVRRLISGYPSPAGFLHTATVFWIGIVAEVILCIYAFKDLKGIKIEE